MKCYIQQHVTTKYTFLIYTSHTLYYTAVITGNRENITLAANLLFTS